MGNVHLVSNLENMAAVAGLPFLMVPCLKSALFEFFPVGESRLFLSSPGWEFQG